MVRTRKHAFTLVELLAVIVIMTIIMGMAGPAFTKLFSGTGVESASRMIGSQLRLARQHAITQRTRVAVLLPGNQGGSTHDDKKFSAMRVCEVDDSNQFVRWVPNTKWVFLPNGAVVYEIDQTQGLTSSGGSITNACLTVTGIPGFGGGSNDSRAIIFRPTGRLPDNFGFASRYIFILEGAYAGSDKPIVKNADNWIEIEVPPLTGRVAFRQPEDT